MRNLDRLCCCQMDKFNVRTVSQMFGTGTVLWRASSSKNVSLMRSGFENVAVLAIWPKQPPPQR